MGYCTSCGKALVGAGRFCGHCGAAVISTLEQQTPPLQTAHLQPHSLTTPAEPSARVQPSPFRLFGRLTIADFFVIGAMGKLAVGWSILLTNDPQMVMWLAIGSFAAASVVARYLVHFLRRNIENQNPPPFQQKVVFGLTVTVVCIGVIALAAGIAVEARKSAGLNESQLPSQPVATADHNMSPNPYAKYLLGEGFSLEQTMQTLYGSFDARRGGSFWTVQGATSDLASTNGEHVFVQPYLSHRYIDERRERILFITHTLQVENGNIVKPGDGCHACTVLLGIFLFERSHAGSWSVVEAHPVVTATGQWGGPPTELHAVGNFSRPIVRINNSGMNQGIVWRVISELHLQDGKWSEAEISRSEELALK